MFLSLRGDYDQAHPYVVFCSRRVDPSRRVSHQGAASQALSGPQQKIEIGPQIDASPHQILGRQKTPRSIPRRSAPA
jgi:hypothetical protein